MKVYFHIGLAVAVSCLLGVSYGASPVFFQQFSDDSWKSSFKQSTDSKYNGQLVAEIPEGLKEPALKASALI